MKSLQIFTQHDLLSSYSQLFDKVDFDSEISLVEQEICFLSDFFMFSTYSSWSTNIVLERIIDGRKDNQMNIEFELRTN